MSAAKVTVAIPGWDLSFTPTDGNARVAIENAIDSLVKVGKVSPIDRDRYVDAARRQCLEQGVAWDRSMAS